MTHFPTLLALFFVAPGCLGSEQYATNNLDQLRDCCLGQHWVFGLPSVNYPPMWSFEAAAAAEEDAVGDTGSGEATARRRLSEVSSQWGGFLPEVIDILSLSMGFTYSFAAAPPVRRSPP